MVNHLDGDVTSHNSNAAQEVIFGLAVGEVCVAADGRTRVQSDQHCLKTGPEPEGSHAHMLTSALQAPCEHHAASFLFITPAPL